MPSAFKLRDRRLDGSPGCRLHFDLHALDRDPAASTLMEFPPTLSVRPRPASMVTLLVSMTTLYAAAP
jgi:hypothetical protein